MKQPDYQWQGAQGYEWWELDIVQGKISSSESELVVKINSDFTVHVVITKRWHEYYCSEIYINDAFYMKSCEHIDEDLYWLFENLDKIVFIHYIKKNKVKTITLKRFNNKKRIILSKYGIKVFTVNGEVNIGDRLCPVCGKYVFSEEENSYDICDYCGWEDEAVSDSNEFSGANSMSINRYKKKYMEYISANPNYIWSKSFKRGKFVDPRKNNKNHYLKQEYKEIYTIVKKHVDTWDCIGLLDLGCPKDEYNIEISEIVPTAYRTDNVEELTEQIVRVFTEYFGETYNSSRTEALAVAGWILKDKAELKIDNEDI